MMLEIYDIAVKTNSNSLVFPDKPLHFVPVYTFQFNEPFQTYKII